MHQVWQGKGLLPRQALGMPVAILSKEDTRSKREGKEGERKG
jgi:hypothetical protein